MSPDARTEPDGAPGEHLQVELRVEPHPGAGCAVLDAGRRGESISRSVSCPDGDCAGGCECNADVTVDDGPPRFVSGPVRERCICPVFRRHECVASIEAFEHGELLVSLSVPDRSELTSIVTELRETGATVRLERLTQPGADGDGRAVELRTDRITDKQREAVRAAIEMGYYDRPRRADLGDLAGRLGVSPSAVSQRLTAVESELIAELYRATGGETAAGTAPGGAGRSAGRTEAAGD